MIEHPHHFDPKKKTTKNRRERQRALHLTDIIFGRQKNWLLVEDQLSPTCTLLASAHEFSGHFFADDNNKWWQSRQQNPTFVSWLIQKKSDKNVNEAEMPVAIINRKNVADWCSNDCKILVRPSFFVVRPFLLISLLIYIFIFPHLTRWR